MFWLLQYEGGLKTIPNHWCIASLSMETDISETKFMFNWNINKVESTESNMKQKYNEMNLNILPLSTHTHHTSRTVALVLVCYLNLAIAMLIIYKLMDKPCLHQVTYSSWVTGSLHAFDGHRVPVLLKDGELAVEFKVNGVVCPHLDVLVFFHIPALHPGTLLTSARLAT